MLYLFHTGQAFGYVFPEIKLAKVGDIAVFQCFILDHVIWKFKMGSLPNTTYSFLNVEYYSRDVVILVDEYSYGDYSCEGIDYDVGMAFYGVAALKPCKLIITAMSLCHYYNMIYYLDSLGSLPRVIVGRMSYYNIGNFALFHWYLSINWY